MFPLNSYAVLGAVCLAALSGVYGYVHGRNGAALECQVKIAEIQSRLDKAKEIYLQQQKSQAEVLERTVAEYARNSEEVSHETKKIIVRPVYRNVCLDSDGLQQLERARTGGKSTASESSSEMP